MAILVIYRDDVFDREVELGEGNARIGRGNDNEIVLADHTKSLSRHHAELRLEQGKYSVVDTNSQNGVWVEGLRVLTATLEPGVPVVLGSYKLLLKEERPSAETGEETLFLRRDADLATIVSKPKAAPPPLAAKWEAPRRKPEPAAPPAAVEAQEEDPSPEPPSSRTDPALRAFISESPPTPKPAPEMLAFKPEPPPAPKRAPAPPMPAVKPEPPPVAAAKSVAAKPVVAATPVVAAKPAVAAKVPGAARRAGKGMSKALMFGGLAVVLLAVMAAAVFLTPLRNRLGLARNEPATSTASAPPAVAPPAVAPPAAALPAAALPAAAPLPSPPVSTPRPPASRGAVPGAGRGNAKPTPGRPLTPARPAAPAPQLMVATPVEPAEPPPKPAPVSPVPTTPDPTPPAPAAAKEPVEKPPDLAAMFAEAQSAMTKGDHLAAIAGFEAVLKADPNYPSAASLLGVTRGGARIASQLAVVAGNKAEMSGDYEGATKQYERALLLDPPSSAAADAMRRLKARMQIEGEDAFKKGKQYDAMGRKQDAISTYGRALQLLPPDHASAKAARERLAALKGGG